MFEVGFSVGANCSRDPRGCIGVVASPLPGRALSSPAHIHCRCFAARMRARAWVCMWGACTCVCVHVFARACARVHACVRVLTRTRTTAARNGGVDVAEVQRIRAAVFKAKNAHKARLKDKILPKVRQLNKQLSPLRVRAELGLASFDGVGALKGAAARLARMGRKRFELRSKVAMLRLIDKAYAQRYRSAMKRKGGKIPSTAVRDIPPFLPGCSPCSTSPFPSPFAMTIPPPPVLSLPSSSPPVRPPVNKPSSSSSCSSCRRRHDL